MSSSSSAECQHRCAQLISFGMLLQDLSTRTDLLKQDHRSPSAGSRPRATSAQQPKPDASLDQPGQLPDRTL
ncbi:hypothetical protein BHE90_015134 [Fusarium euwallaceae]|uniref:Uncharacterized protein n=4 Tax=Fusarium solani species complex TaxID=232080 RepID=A0A428UI19_9HYPO|nr:hypothetical protein CEP51_014309 [Fusarium floridanum]RSL93437.1 hypothetical protein CDV31_014707 [Fusarium ambrosium]RSM13920.1 hypothetical protein CEP52_001626 [Fusarium oligoseptatum]RTE70469.1 hypothetical protein BHE90_015134 [Fusarium euwallaceae]